jgi:hypothetical protein
MAKVLHSEGAAPRRPPTNPRRPRLRDGAEESLHHYIDRFIENGLKLQDELMVNHEAIAAAKAERLAEFRRKRR